MGKDAAVALALGMLGCGFSGSGVADRVDATVARDDATADTMLDAQMLDAVVPAACLTSPAYSPRPNTNHRYRVSPTGSYDDVIDACALDGAHLAVIEDTAENTYVASLADGLWIGYDDLDTEGAFGWITSTANGFTKWAAPGEPSNSSGNEDCTYILPIGQQNKWNDDQCALPHAGACECEPGYTAPPIPSCRTATGAVIANGRRYFVHAAARNWVDAQSDCASTGAYLVVPSDDTENAVVDGTVTVDAWIGISQLQTAGVFAPVDGAPPGYTKWTPQAPSSGMGQECVAMKTNGEWEDQSCAANHAYVCECDPAPP